MWPQTASTGIGTINWNSSLFKPFKGFSGDSAQHALSLDSEELSSLLEAVLPTFIAVADRTLHSSTQPLNRNHVFYLELLTGLANLQVYLVQWNPADLIQTSSAEEAQMKLLLHDVLVCLEGRFLSRTKGKDHEKVAMAFSRLKIEAPRDEKAARLWKLRALENSKMLPARDKDMPESYLENICVVIRLDKNSDDEQRKLLRVVQAAVEFFMNMQFLAGRPASPCPLDYFSYPMKHVSKLTKTLFGVIQSKWSCTCNGSQSHISREARWNLTQHQRFDTAPISEPAEAAKTRRSMQRYRVLFPMTAHQTEWQDTDIEVYRRRHVSEQSWDINEDLCGVISGVKLGIRPRMSVWNEHEELRLLRAGAEERPSVLTQIKETEFVSLKELLLQPSYSNWWPKNRLILSFILATTLLHLSQPNDPHLRAHLNSDSICFLRPPQSAPPDITRPYLTVTCAPGPSANQQTSSSEWNQPHRFPDMLALGILLLEIQQWAPMNVATFQDPCQVAIGEFDNWTKTMSSSLSVPEGLRHAIAACIQPSQLQSHDLCEHEIKDRNVRRYIFDRILYPLEDALSTAHEIKPYMLPADLERNKAGVESSGFFDGEDNIEVKDDQKAAASEWTTNLNGVHKLVRECQARCEELTERNEMAERVKIAVLDTGLQLPGPLRQNYEAAGRILVNESKSFVRRTDSAASEHDWDSDSDGHGSRVGEIILRCSPCADLYVAKVFRNGRDLAIPDKADQVHKQIAEAIVVATNTWKVDIIVMCFGFDKPIPLIRAAINAAIKKSNPPLFFAATGNNGAHRDIAWPARDLDVIGISSTTGYGEASEFNPREVDTAFPVLYAFGQGVPVKVAASDNPNVSEDKYVSGTSYATPVAVSLVANLLGSVRMLLETSASEDRVRFAHLPGDLQKMGGMLRVLQSRMQRESNGGRKSILPWELLCLSMAKDNKLLKKVDRIIN